MFRAISKTEKEKKSMDVLIVEPEKVPPKSTVKSMFDSSFKSHGECKKRA